MHLGGVEGRFTRGVAFGKEKSRPSLYRRSHEVEQNKYDEADGRAHDNTASIREGCCGV